MTERDDESDVEGAAERRVAARARSVAASFSAATLCSAAALCSAATLCSSAAFFSAATFWAARCLSRSAAGSCERGERQFGEVNKRKSRIG